MSELTTEQVSEVLDAHPWRFAKTMPDNPHDYTLRKQWDDSLFSRVVQHLREHGYRTWFNGRPYTQYDSGDYFYWTMGAPLSETILINRKLRKTAIAMAYDRIAATYDSLFNDETSKEEEQELFARIGNLSQLSVLDVGCGTGLLLDYAIPTGYCEEMHRLHVSMILTRDFEGAKWHSWLSAHARYARSRQLT